MALSSLEPREGKARRRGWKTGIKESRN